MGYLFFDESIHTRGKFILGAFVYSQRSPAWRVNRALRRVGLVPGVDEYKSGARAVGNESRVTLRDSLRLVVLRHTRIAVVVAPLSDRDRLGSLALAVLGDLISQNGLKDRAIVAYFDQGLFSSPDDAAALAVGLSLPGTIRLAVEQDSRVIRGLQLADLVAHTCATMMLSEMGLVTKSVKSRDPTWDHIPLDFELWGSIRYAFFRPSEAEFNPKELRPGPWFDVSAHALFFSPNCDDQLRAAATATFARLYLGCIH